MSELILVCRHILALRRLNDVVLKPLKTQTQYVGRYLSKTQFGMSFMELSKSIISNTDLIPF